MDISTVTILDSLKNNDIDVISNNPFSIPDGDYVIGTCPALVQGNVRQLMVFLPHGVNQTITLIKAETYGGNIEWRNRVDITASTEFRTEPEYLNSLYYVVGHSNSAYSGCTRLDIFVRYKTLS